jgi:copper homeostasis protein (lipoprotein)
MGKVLPVIVIILVVLAVGLILILKNPLKNETSISTSEIDAVYSGTLPCADCPGIDETITFYKNNTYADKSVYQERNVTNITQGTWVLDKSIFQLKSLESSNSSYYQIQGDKIIPLDPDTKKPIDAPFDLSLTKQQR